MPLLFIQYYEVVNNGCYILVTLGGHMSVNPLIMKLTFTLTR